MIKKIFILFLSLILGLAIFFRVVNNIGWQAIQNTLYVFTGLHGLIILILTFLSVVVGTWKWQEILGRHYKIPFQKLFGFYLAGYSVMFFAPIIFWGGEFLRAYALKERYAVPWPKSMASVGIDRILEWTINLAIIFAAGFILIFSTGFPLERLTVILAGLFMGLLTILAFFYFRCIRKESIVELLMSSKQNQVVDTEKEIFSFFKVKNMAMWRAFFITLIKSLILYLRAFLLIMFLGKKIGVMVVFSIFGFSYLATVVPLPAALGIHEATQIFVFKSFRLENYTAAAFTMTLRWAEIFIAFFGIIVICFIGAELLKNTMSKKINPNHNKIILK